MIHLDTNTLIRFFIERESPKALKVKNLIETEKEIFIADVVFPEIEYVLAKPYAIPRIKILEIFKFIASRPNIKINSHIQQAISIFQKTNVDMADCIITALSFEGKLASFDEKLTKIEGVKNYWPTA